MTSPYQTRDNDSKAQVVWHETRLAKAQRASAKGQIARCVWLTGLSGSGKSTLANALEVALAEQGKHTYLLDGDNVRHGLNKDLGMSAEDRAENIRRVAEVAKLMVDAGLVVITAFISPFRDDRRIARELFEAGEFVEVFVDAPLAECERRDPKGLYKKARSGEIKQFTGIDSPYEAPESAEIVLQTAQHDVGSCVKQLMERLQKM
jgi:adenylyl-sulfate kinase